MAQSRLDRCANSASRSNRVVLSLLLLWGVTLGACSSGAGAFDSPIAVQPANKAEPHAVADGIAHFKAARYGRAADYLEQALQSHPNDVRVLNALGAAYDRLGRYDLAMRLYHRALQQDPDDPQTLNNLGYSYLLQERLDLAIAYLVDAEERLAERGDVDSEQLQRVQANLAAAELGEPSAPVTMAFAGSLRDSTEIEAEKTVATLPRVLRSGRAHQYLVTRGDSLARVPGVTHDLAEAADRTAPPEPPARRAPTLALVTQEPLPSQWPDSGYEALASARIELSNGAGLRGMAASFRRHLGEMGIEVSRLTNADRFSYAHTMVFHRPGFAKAATWLARELGVMDSAVELAPGQVSDIRVRLGGDLVPFAHELQSQEKGAIS